MVNETYQNKEQIVWVLKDERPGTGNQALGVAEALGINYHTIELKLANLGRLPNLLLGTSLLSITSNSRRHILPPWPDLVISAGRRAASVACYIKRRSKGRSFVCQVMYPGYILARDIDLIIAPNHDKRTGDNIISVAGAPNRITDSLLSDARTKWRQQFVSLAKPVVGVVVGGAGRRMPFGNQEAKQLAHYIIKQKKTHGGSVVVTTSRRTGIAASVLFDTLKASDCEPDYWHRWEASGENPYIGILAYSDVLVVTGDSITMLSEACASPGFVYIFAPDSFRSTKHLSHHEELYNLNAARPLEERSEDWQSRQFNSSVYIAEHLRTNLGWLIR